MGAPSTTIAGDMEAPAVDLTAPESDVPSSAPLRTRGPLESEFLPTGSRPRHVRRGIGERPAAEAHLLLGRKYLRTARLSRRPRLALLIPPSGPMSSGAAENGPFSPVRELREQSLRTSSRNLMRPRREEPVGTVVPLSTEDRAFLETARTCSFPISTTATPNATARTAAVGTLLLKARHHDALQNKRVQERRRTFPLPGANENASSCRTCTGTTNGATSVPFTSHSPTTSSTQNLARQHGMPLIGALFEAGEGPSTTGTAASSKTKMSVRLSDSSPTSSGRYVTDRASSIAPAQYVPRGTPQPVPGSSLPAKPAQMTASPCGVTENQGGSDKDVLNDPSFAQGPDPDGYKGIMKLENAEHREIWFKALVEEA